MRSPACVSLLSLLLGSAVFSADPQIRLPKNKVDPPPSPGVVVVLASDEWYVVESDVELAAVLTFPDGLLSFEKTEPGYYRGKFAGGGGKVEARKLAGPFVYLGTATGAGRAKASFVPKGVKDGSEIVHALVDCLVAPKPPPPTPPGPTPPGPTPPGPVPPPEPTTSFKVIFVYDTASPVTPAMQKVLFGEKVVQYLDANTTLLPGGTKGWRRFSPKTDASADKDVVIREVWAAVAPDVKTVPCVVIATTTASGKRAVIENFPADEDAAVALFQKYKGSP